MAFHFIFPQANKIKTNLSFYLHSRLYSSMKLCLNSHREVGEIFINLLWIIQDENFFVDLSRRRHQSLEEKGNFHYKSEISKKIAIYENFITFWLILRPYKFSKRLQWSKVNFITWTLNIKKKLVNSWLEFFSSNFTR